MPDTSNPATSHTAAAPPRGHILMALAVCLSVVLFQTLWPEFRRPVADAAAYAAIDAGIADAILGRASSAEPVFGMYFAPLYHGLVGLLAAADGELLKTLHCVKDLKAQCSLDGLTVLLIVQGILAALTAFFLFMASHCISADLRVAWITLVIALWTKVFSGYASQLLTECLTFFFVFLFNWMLAAVVTSPRPRALTLVIAGVALGAAALTRPSYLYLIYFMMPVFAIWRYAVSKNARITVTAVVAFAAGAAVCLIPWMTRNMVTFDQFALTSSQGAKVMVERLPYNLMTWGEWARSFIYWLPDFGDSLAAAIFERADYIRLSWEDPASFYMMGRGDFFNQVWPSARSHPSPLGYLLSNHVVNDPFKHAAVTVALAWRGMFVARYVGLAGFFLLPAAWKIISQRGRCVAFVVYALPGFFMLGLYAFVSVNVVRYNEPLIAVFALSVGVAVVWLVDQARARLKSGA